MDAVAEKRPWPPEFEAETTADPGDAEQAIVRVSPAHRWCDLILGNFAMIVAGPFIGMIAGFLSGGSYYEDQLDAMECSRERTNNLRDAQWYVFAACVKSPGA
jgi:hypothetical protein